jgi:hypothetical protein
MHASVIRWLTIASVVSSCGAPVELTTGLDGSVHRGPVTPVCMAGVPCDAPFAANFEVRRGSRRVATFRSDSAGHFTVRLPPGSYTIVPGSDAPLLNPTMQVRSVEVGATGLTSAQLTFDTGIR